jgi:restriction system protein
MGANSRSRKFQQYVKSDLLREEKLITAPTKPELRMKIDRQQRLWKEQEAHVLGVQTAEQKTQEAQALLVALTELLKREVQKGTKPGWQVRGNHSAMYPPFLEKEAPTYEDSVQLYVPPSVNPFLEMFTPGLKKDRERAKALAQQHYQQVRAEYDQERSRRLNIYQMQKQAYEQGDVRAIKFVLKEILRNLNFPCGYGRVFEIDFDMDAEEAILEMRLPHVSEMPTITRYRYMRQQKKLEEARLTANQIRDRYQDLLAQLTLATLFRLFHDATTPYLQSIVFNGYVSGVHPATGRSFTSCVLTVRAERREFEGFDLVQVVPTTCLRSLRGLSAGPLIDMLPVKPIRYVNMEDDRFIETVDVLAHYPSIVNIATMPWLEFEHLIATLFNKIFQGFGGEVRVTRSSRDYGVDAKAFDPDPLRGGSIIIQAKRYQDLVPNAHVRELIGVMDIERATRGYLVTTGRFSKAAYDLAKEHNVQLFDGQNLLHQLHHYGFTDLTLQKE